MTKHSVSHSHPGEDILELYCLDRLDEEAMAPIEEHLMICEACQKQVTGLDAFLKAAKTATRELQVEEKYREPALAWTWLRNPAWLAAGAAAMLAVVAIPSFRTPSMPQSVELAAYRGGEEGTGAGVADSGRPLHLNLDLTGINPANCCVLQLVDANGKQVSQSTATVTDARATFEQQKGLDSGQYWLRVRSKDGQDLREMGLRVR